MVSRASSLTRVAAALSAMAVVVGCATSGQTGFGDSGPDTGVDAGKRDARHASDAASEAKSGTACVPGRQLACGCGGGALLGYQVCAADGSGYGPCVCGVDAGPDAVAEAATDARTDTAKPKDAGHDARADARDATTPRDAGRDVSVDGARPDSGVDASTCPLSTVDAGAGGTLSFAESFGLTGFTWPASVAFDPSTGDIVVAGFFDGSMNVGGQVLTSHGDAAAGYDTFVVKLDASGHVIWAKDFGNGRLTSANSVAVDSAGNVVLGGGFEGTLAFGGTPLTAVGDIDIFVVQLDSAGNFAWGKSYGVAGQDQELDTVAVDADDNVILGGVAVGGVNFGNGPATGYYIAKLSQAGDYVWATAVDTSCDDSSPTLAVDPQSNIFLAGCFAGTLSFGGTAFTSQSGGDAFVAKYNAGGMFQWANDYAAIPTGSVGSGSEVSSGGLAVDGCGNVYVIGGFGAASGVATIDFGSSPLMSGTDSMFLAKIDGAGNGVWSHAFVAATEHSLYPGALAVDGEGVVTLTLGLAGTVNFGGAAVSSLSADSPTLALASFAPNGIHRWSYAETTPSTAPSASAAAPQGVAAHGTSLVLAGTFGGCVASCNDGVSPAGTTLVFPGQTLTAVSAGDMFLAGFSP